MSHTWNDFSLGVVRPCSRFDLAGLEHVIPRGAQDKQRSLYLFRFGQIQRDHIQKSHKRIILHLFPIRQQLFFWHILREKRLAYQCGSGNQREQTERQVDLGEESADADGRF